MESVCILSCMLFNWSLDNGVMMTLKRQAINLSWFFIMINLLQQISTDHMTLFPISLLLGGLIFSFYNFGNPKGNSKQIREVITKGSLTWALGRRSWHSGEIWNSSVVNTKAVSFIALYLLKMPISITLWDILPEKKWLVLGSSKHALTQILHYQIQNNTVKSLITSQQIQPTISEAPDKLYLINLLHQLEFST